jgi:hypothetical protein
MPRPLDLPLGEIQGSKATLHAPPLTRHNRFQGYLSLNFDLDLLIKHHLA